MRFWIALPLCAALASSACSDDTQPNENATRVALLPTTTLVHWTITPDGIGSLRLGGAVPEPKQGFEAMYRTSFYGDAQPLEGFAFDDPPVLAVFKGGPFTSWGSNHVGHEAPDAIKTRAIALAGARRFKIEMLVITDRRPKTAAGISVGDDYATFARAYPRAPAPEAYRGLWEEPSCMVSHDTIWFFFDRCDDADRAKIIRIAVRTQGCQV